MTELDDVSSLPSSRRTAGDTWAITESVGATALGVAAARAVETAATNPLIRDEFAKVLVSSAGTAWARLADADLAWLDGDQLGRRVHRVACDYQAVRTHFFDEYFGAAVDAGVRQVVILAAGLDARAYRLNWPAGTVVYEIDQPSVLEYKAGILQSHGAVPTARRHAVAVDLRDDWPAALIAAGFDGTQPTAWLAEGLLPYLPGDAADRLFDMVTALSAPGSQVAVEAFTMNTGQHAALESDARATRFRHRCPGVDLPRARPVGCRAMAGHAWLAGAQREQSRGDGPTGPGDPARPGRRDRPHHVAARASGHTRSTGVTPASREPEGAQDERHAHP